MVELQVNFIYGLGDLIASTTWAVNLCSEFRAMGYESEVVITTNGNAYYMPDTMSVFDIIDKNSIPVPIKEVNSRYNTEPSGKSYVYTTENRDMIGAHWLDIFCEPRLQSILQEHVNNQQQQIAYSCAGFANHPLPRIKIDVVEPSAIKHYRTLGHMGAHIRVEDRHTPEEVDHFKPRIDQFFEQHKEELFFVCSNSTYLKEYVKSKYPVITYTGVTEKSVGFNFRHPSNNIPLRDTDPQTQRNNVKDTMTEMILLSNSKSLYTLGYYGEGRISNFLYLSLLKGLKINQIVLQ